jgi:hypothetical protein
MENGGLLKEPRRGSRIIAENILQNYHNRSREVYQTHRRFGPVEAPTKERSRRGVQAMFVIHIFFLLPL